MPEIIAWWIHPLYDNNDERFQEDEFIVRELAEVGKALVWDKGREGALSCFDVHPLTQLVAGVRVFEA